LHIRSFASAAVAALALAAVGLAGDAAKPAPHPHFDDGGTLSWSTKVADAQAAAKASGKLILIEYGRED
jgi:hypothetical protein